MRKNRDSQDLLQFIGRELEDLNSKPFQVVPHRSGYVEGVDSEKLKNLRGLRIFF